MQWGEARRRDARASPNAASPASVEQSNTTSQRDARLNTSALNVRSGVQSSGRRRRRFTAVREAPCSTSNEASLCGGWCLNEGVSATTEACLCGALVFKCERKWLNVGMAQRGCGLWEPSSSIRCARRPRKLWELEEQKGRTLDRWP